MTFFARPDLSNEQFKQLSDSILTLSGTTQIASISGLSLNDNFGNYITLAADNGLGLSTPTHGMVLGFDSIANRIRLMDISGGTGIGVYLGKSPTTVSVGGLPANTQILGSGFTCILQMMLVPTVNPSIIAPSQTFSTIPPSSMVFEVGESLNITGGTIFNRGSVNPVYDGSGNTVCASGSRAGIPFQYVYGGNIQAQSTLPSIINFTGNSINHSTSTINIDIGNNNWISCVRFCSGSTVFNSACSVFVSGLTSGFTQTNINFTGIFPFYWGRWTSSSAPAGVNRPTIGQIVTCINHLNMLRATSEPSRMQWIANNNATCIVVAPTANIITANFNSNSDDYIWFAIQSHVSVLPIYTNWFITESNRGIIGGAVSPGGHLFPSPITMFLNSSKWELAPSLRVDAPFQFNLYLSNYQTSVNIPMQIRNI